MEKDGLVQTCTREYILCAEPQDSDYPPKNRHCRGRLYVDDGLDEAGHDFRCPECDRPVFPFRHKKLRHKELRAKLLPQGITSYILSELAKLKSNVKEISAGVYRIDIGDMGLLVCIADYCSDEKFLTRDWARTQTTCYLVVNPKGVDERFLDEDWIIRTSLADIICGQTKIKDWVCNAAECGPPQSVRTASVPVYTKGATPIVAEPVAPYQAARRFVVECGPNTVVVEGEMVVAPQAGTRFDVFRILWDQFLDDMRQAVLPEQHRLINIKDIIKEIEARTEKYVEDETSIRRTINRLQSDIETAIKKKLGLPIDREDIVQTCRWKGQGEGDFGYRINPFTVAARPFLPDRS
ncbi:MAG: hypothetical protein ABID54_11830 [Pseudomonadota bacterium]